MSDLDAGTRTYIWLSLGCLFCGILSTALFTKTSTCIPDDGSQENKTLRNRYYFIGLISLFIGSFLLWYLVIDLTTIQNAAAKVGEKVYNAAASAAESAIAKNSVAVERYVPTYKTVKR